MKSRAVIPVVAVLAAVAALVGCGQHAPTAAPVPTAGVRLTPSSTPPPQPGSQVDVLGQGLLAISPDGGASWATHRLKPSFAAAPQLYWSLTSSDPAHIWAVSRDGAVVRATADGGLIWRTQFSDPVAELRGVACTDARHIWAVGDVRGRHALVLASSDGGRTWARQAEGMSGRLFGVAFSDASHGWAVGATTSQTSPGKVFVMRTQDGGVHWRIVYSRSGDRSLVAVAATDPRHCWVVGASPGRDPRYNYATGWVLATADGGAHWVTQVSDRFDSLLGASFVDDQHGWAVGYAGSVIATSDGGRTWEPQRSGPDALVTGVSFRDAKVGWAAVPGEAAVLSTRDGGLTWTTIRLATPEGRYGFVDVAVPASQRNS